MCGSSPLGLVVQVSPTVPYLMTGRPWLFALEVQLIGLLRLSQELRLFLVGVVLGVLFLVVDVDQVFVSKRHKVDGFGGVGQVLSTQRFSLPVERHEDFWVQRGFVHVGFAIYTSFTKLASILLVRLFQSLYKRKDHNVSIE